MFADDTVLAARGNSAHQTATTLQAALNEVADWADVEGLSFNIGKSNAILFYSHNQRDPPQYPPLYLKNQAISYITETTYLGILLTAVEVEKPLQQSV